jgi:cytochrome oxidase Cu insertion factor (SCO1/SenC/PrrC family)
MNRQAKYFRRLIRLSLGLAVMLMLAGTVAAVEVGQPAPDFSLTSTSGDKVSLSQFRGKKHVLIQFYSVDFNPT